MWTACEHAPLSLFRPCSIAVRLSFVPQHKWPENTPRVQAHLRRWYWGAPRWLWSPPDLSRSVDSSCQFSWMKSLCPTWILVSTLSFIRSRFNLDGVHMWGVLNYAVRVAEHLPWSSVWVHLYPKILLDRGQSYLYTRGILSGSLTWPCVTTLPANERAKKLTNTWQPPMAGTHITNPRRSDGMWFADVFIQNNFPLIWALQNVSGKREFLWNLRLFFHLSTKWTTLLS